MHCDRFAGFLVNDEDNAAIERHNRPQLVCDQRDCVVHVERGADRLGDLMQCEDFTLSFRDRTEAGGIIRST